MNIMYSERTARIISSSWRWEIIINNMLHDEVTRTIAAGSYNLELEARKNVTPQR